MKKCILAVLIVSLASLLSCSKSPPSESAKKKCINNDCTKAVNDCPSEHTCGGETCKLHKDCYKGFICSQEKKCAVDESLSGSNSENPPGGDGSQNDGGTDNGDHGDSDGSLADDSSNHQQTTTEKCSNNLDKDGDGLAGIMDPDCQSDTCIGEPKACAECGVCSKAFEPCFGELYVSCEMNLVKGYEKDKETKCEDKEDNDCDCLADLEDPDCLTCKEGDVSSDPCPLSGVGVCNIHRTCVNNSYDDPKSCEFPKEYTGDASEKFGGKNHFGQDICSDALDNDCDGKTDCEETECGESSSCGCTYIPPIGVFDPVLKFHWPYDQIQAGASITVPNSTNVLTTPTVANLSDDNGDNLIDDSDIPDIVFVTYVDASTMGINGTLRAISGDDGHEIFTVTGYAVYPSTTVAIGDINNDGFVELVLDQGADYNTVGIYVFSHTGQYMWEASGSGTYIGGAGISDIDHDGTPEILLANSVYDPVGNLKCTLEGNAYDWTAPFALDLTGVANANDVIINRRGIWKYEAGNTNCPKLWSFQPIGWKAVANLDNDASPEIVSVSGGGKIRIYEHDGTLKKEFDIPVDPDRENPDPKDAIGARGGPPTLSDFDGDGQVEIAVASSFYYFVFETDGTVNWAHKTQDFTSGITGSSLFDFDGDGIAEVIYGDEHKMRIYSGPGGSGDSDNDGYKDADILYEYSVPSATRVEYPVVVDVDGDGKAEIVVSANYWGGSGSPGEEGIYVFEDRLDNWMPTRKIWNQHAYHVTNVNENGSIPKNPQKNWQIPGLNNFRQNTKILTQIDYAAPDLIIPFVDEKAHNCNTSVTLTARISNIGQLEVRPGVKVSFFKKSIADGTVTEIGTAKTKKVIKPQSYEIVEFAYTFASGEKSKDFLFSALADSDNTVNECREDNNESPAINLPVCP